MLAIRFMFANCACNKISCPGMDIPLHFTATQVGKYEIVCTQLCGLGHYNMKAYLEVMTRSGLRAVA